MYVCVCVMPTMCDHISVIVLCKVVPFEKCMYFTFPFLNLSFVIIQGFHQKQ